MTNDKHIEQVEDKSDDDKVQYQNQLSALVIEDDPDAAFIFKKALMDSGYKVTLIANGGDAKQSLEILRPNIILLDLRLPEVNGIALFNHIRSRKDMKGIVIVLTTADHRLANTVARDADLVMLKPITYSEVKNLLGKIDNTPI